MKKILLSIIFIIGVSSLSYSTVVIGGSLLSYEFAETIEHEIGEGELVFTNIFHNPGNLTANDFHTSVDGISKTVVLMQSINGTNANDIIGGYNPFAWQSSKYGHYTLDYTPGEAFIFNLSTNDIRHQTAVHSTYNRSDLGPIFGMGFDLYVNNSLDSAVTNNRSYANGLPTGYQYGITADASPFNISSLQIFSISEDNSPEPQPSLPEPTSVITLIIGFFGLLKIRKGQ